MHLEKMPTGPDKSVDKDDIKEETEKLLEEIHTHRRKMFAQEKHSLLLVFQWIDASGKNSTTRELFSHISPTGVHVAEFKKPTKEELAHDFLWRVHKHTPKQWDLVIFNRSHYEDILVPYVEESIDKDRLKRRYEHINNFERLLKDNNTHIVKIFLHTSKEEQEEDLVERLVEKEKHWKHNDADRETRKQWDQYMEAYEKMIQKCNDIPWHVIPSDKKRYRVNLIAKILVEEFEKMDLEWPDLDTERFKDGYDD